MATGDRDVRRHHRRHRSDSHRRHDSPFQQNIEPDTTAPASDAFENPGDITALREARLKSMETPAISRKKMKIEYEYTKPAKASVKTKAPTVVSTGFFGKRPAVTSEKSKSATVVPARQGSSDGVYQYVYRDGQGSGLSENAVPKESRKASTKQPKPAIERRKTVSSTTEKPKSERRRTEPVVAIRRLSTTAAARPQIQKSSSSVEDFVYKSGTAATAKPAKPQRTSSILGSIFTKPPPVPERQVSCLTCGSDDIPVSKSAKLPCTHRMCHSCLKRIFKMSVKDPAHMPPRCCTDDAIKLKHVEHLFNDDFKKTWNRKFKEYNTKNKIYCPKRGCGEWIQPKHFKVVEGRKVGVCPKCKYNVCPTCNQKAHRARECPKDPAMRQLSEMAQQQGWVKCYNCSAMVELKEGCNHMTCRCMAEFCMVCGLKWKSCDCPWFNYEAVDDLRGNPVRYQQEMDRRAEQLHRDEEIAREMAGLGLRNPGRRRPGNAVTPAEFNAEGDWLQQARDALTARYPNNEEAARGLLGGWLNWRDNPAPVPVPVPVARPPPPPPAMPGAFDANEPIVDLPPARRRAYRLRHANLGPNA